MTNRTPQPKKSLPTKLVGVLGLIGIAVITLILTRWFIGTAIPKLEVPPHPMPTVNAHNTFKDATKLVKHKTIAENAFAEVTPPNVGKISQADIEKAYIANQPALKKMREGLKQEYVEPPIRSLLAMFPHLPEFRGLGRVARFSARVEERKGKWNEAMKTRLDCIEMGIKIPRRSVLIGQLVGVAITSLGRSGSFETVKRLNHSEAMASLRRLEGILQSEFPLSLTFQEEKWSMLSGLNEIWRSPETIKKSKGEESEAPEFIPTGVGNLYHLIHTRTEISKNLANYMDKLSEFSKISHFQRSKMKPIPMPQDIISRVMLPVFDQALIRVDSSKTSNRMLLVALALQCYRTKHGGYPEKLSALQGAYFKTLPLDPFGNKETFKYQRNGNSYLLYSIGPDGKDDKGKPIFDASKVTEQNKNAGYRVEEKSIGDIVAGVHP